MALSGADKSGFAGWWWTVDRIAFFAMIALIAIGLVLAVAASPAATGGPLTPGDFRYAIKQIAFALVAAIILVGSSLLTLRQVKLVAAVAFALALIGSTLVLFTGNELLGARRWIDLGWMTLQPSEFLKPGFAVLGAAILADKSPMPLPRPALTFLLIAPAMAVLALQPDFGQAFLLLALW